jgi:cytochrome c biogenesis protein CcdA
MNLQAWISQEVSQLAGVLQVSYAFGAGMVSAVNPCGFAMLPVYLSLYLGTDDKLFQQRSWLYRLSKAVGISLVVTAGFGVLFGVIGIVVSAGGSLLIAILPWVSVLVGSGLVLLGIWMLLGNYLSIDLFMKWGNRIGDPRTISIKGFFLFGLAFGATSMGCTLPIFLVVVGGSLTSGDFVTGVIQFVWYILGAGTILLFLTVGMVFIKRGAVVGALSRFVPYVQKISAGLLIIAGLYICYYWLSSGILFD